MNDDGRGRDSGDGNHAAVGTESDVMRRRLRRPFGFGAAAGRIGTTLPPTEAAAFPVAGLAGAVLIAAFPGAVFSFATGFAFAPDFGLAVGFDGTSLSFGLRTGADGFLDGGFFGATFFGATFFGATFFGATFFGATFFVPAFRDGLEGRTGFFATGLRTAATARLTVVFVFFAAFDAGFDFEAGGRFDVLFTLETVFFEGVTLPEGFRAPPVFFPFTGMAILAGPEVYP